MFNVIHSKKSGEDKTLKTRHYPVIQYIWKQFVQCLSQSSTKTHEWTFR